MMRPSSIPMLLVLLPFLLLAHRSSLAAASPVSSVLRRRAATAGGEGVQLHNLTWTSERGALLLNGWHFHLKGINWFGAETDMRAPSGLWAVPLDDVLDFLARNNVSVAQTCA